MKYKLLKESALRELVKEDYDDVTQGELEDMGIYDPREAGLLPRHPKDGKLYQSPPNGTIEHQYKDGSADVWCNGKLVRMSKEQMMDKMWAERDRDYLSRAEPDFYNWSHDDFATKRASHLVSDDNIGDTPSYYRRRWDKVENALKRQKERG